MAMCQMPAYRELIWKLRRLCHNKSELDGASPDWQSHYYVEPHHINGRNGDLFLDSFNIIMLTRTQHDLEEGRIPGQKVGKVKLLAIVHELRIKQGFKPKENDSGRPRWASNRASKASR